MKRLTAILVVVSCIFAAVIIFYSYMIAPVEPTLYTVTLNQNDRLIRATYDCIGVLNDAWYQDTGLTTSPMPTNTVYGTLKVYDGDTVRLPELNKFSRGGYTVHFTGWYLDAECTTAFDESKPISGNVTLYAGWRIYRIIPYEKVRA